MPDSEPMDCSPPGSSVHGIFSGKNPEVDCHFLLQGISWRTTYSNTKILIFMNNMDKFSNWWAKDAFHKRVHTVWFHLYEVLKQIKLASDEINQSNGYSLWGVTGIRKEETFWGDRNILHFDKSVSWHRCLSICQHSDSPLRSVCFTLCERHFRDFSGDPVVEGSPTNAGDTGLIPGLAGFHMLQDS